MTFRLFALLLIASACFADELLAAPEPKQHGFRDSGLECKATVLTGELTKIYWNTSHPMVTGKGERQDEFKVKFPECFSEPPKVLISLVSLDGNHTYNLRYILTTNSITKKGFKIVLKTWASTKLYLIGISWMAINI